MENMTFLYASEVQGRGSSIPEDYWVALLILLLALTTVILGVFNLYFIWKFTIFHNAFGWLWASRTAAEMMTETIHVVYNVPITILQPKNIPPAVGIAPYFLACAGAVCACMMHEMLSVNRCFAVYSPSNYKRIFTKRICRGYIVLSWTASFVIASAYILFPCNLIGYSPQLYEYVFIKCSADLERDISLVGTFVYWLCAFLCICTIGTDVMTFIKITYIRKAINTGVVDSNVQRDIRFFFQSAVQNITMTLASAMLIYSNNRNEADEQLRNILGFNTIVLTHACNGLTLIVFNPEIRRRFMRQIAATYSTSSTASIPVKIFSASTRVLT